MRDFVSAIAKDGQGMVIWQDTLYELIKGCGSENVVTLEKKQHEIKRVGSLANLEDIVCKKNIAQHVRREDAESALFAFAESFLDYFTHPDHTRVVTPHNEARLHQVGEPSFFSQVFIGPAFLISGGLLYYARRGTGDSTAILDGEPYAFVRPISLADADEAYDAFWQARMEEQPSAPAANACSNQPAFPLGEENVTGEVGWLPDDGDCYLYINKPSYLYHATAEEKRFRFPSCTLGIRLIMRDDGVVDYD